MLPSCNIRGEAHEADKLDSARPDLWVIDGLATGLLLDSLNDDTDDTKSTIPDIDRILMRDSVAGEEGPLSKYD